MPVLEGEAIEIHRLVVLRAALRLEAKGLKMSRRGSALSLVKRDFPQLAKKTAALTLPGFEEMVTGRLELWREAGKPGYTGDKEGE